MTILDAAILGLVEGLTEFLPISSSGHLILARVLLGINTEGGLAFDAVLQLAAALVVLVYFRRDIFNFFTWARWYVFNSGDVLWAGPLSNLYFGIAVATVPAVLLGLVLERMMETVFRAPVLVALAGIVGSIVMLLAERCMRGNSNETPTLYRAFAIGLFQSLALVPGMSRSGMTIAGGMFMGLSREAAARFGFLIAIPILLGSGAKKLLDLGGSGALSTEWLPLAVGSVVAFAVGFAVIHYLMKYLRTRSLYPFIWYRIALALVILGSASML